MTQNKILQALVQAINSTEKLNGGDFNKHPDALYAYEILFGKERLKEVLESKNDLEYNAFYNVSGLFKIQIKNPNTPLDLAKHHVDKIISYFLKNHMLIYLIEIALSREEVKIAEHYINELSTLEQNSMHHGYRKFLDYYATKGSYQEFKNYLKLSKPAKPPRNIIDSSKTKFISKYSEINGIEKGVTIINDKIFGWKYCYALIEKQAHNYSLKEIEKFLNKYPKFVEHDQYIKPWFFVLHYSNQRPTEISDKEFNELLELIMTVDKSLKRGDGRLRDYMLFDIGGSVSDLNQINECKKNIIAPFYKRELNYHIKNLKEKTMGNKV
ncbi:hypothetical protein [Algibacter mikhailovii]|uniref:Uncharacterized protein n=1 Tax=Algibacter mikhailovii TaxID=425498 RepID=A0A918RD99_9FLAO|nr:hypothetical protein [Algibacter mikhailovii]GGZ94579.1 hypothetical protein GCM10007028_36110 [Algibacter mikhailovii]